MPKILIVDDSPNLDGFLKEVLLRKGYAVHAVSDPANGFLLFKNQKPDLVFAGVRVRGEGGWEFVEKIRAANPDVPVAILGNAVAKEAEEKAAGMNCAGFIYKGLKPEDFLVRVMDICARCAPLSKGKTTGITKGRLLIVDDEAVIRDVLSRFLKKKGYDIVTASNGREAMDLIKKERPHLMLLDLRMPEMDGFEVLRRLRKVDQEIAVIVITANSDLEQARQTMEMGACDYVVKPFHLDYLETTVMAKLLMVTA
jgi:two-component system, response regulator, stage 0 sporulation protein F